MKGKSIAALILGISGLASGIIPYACFGGIILSIVGMVLGKNAINEAVAQGVEPNGMAKTGKILGTIGLIASIVMIIISIVLIVLIALGQINGGYYGSF